MTSKKDLQIRLKSGTFPEMYFEFSYSSDYPSSRTMTLSPGDKHYRLTNPTKPSNLTMGKRTISMVVDHNKNVRINEQHGKDGGEEYKACIKLMDGTFTILRNCRVSVAWVLELELVEGALFTIDMEDRGTALREALKDKSSRRTYKLSCVDELLRQTLQLVVMQAGLAKCRYMRLTVPNCDSHSHIHLDRLKDTFEGKFVNNARIFAADFVRDLRAAVNNERQNEDEDRRKLTRNDVIVQFFRPSHMPHQLHVSVTPTPSPDQESWTMGPQEVVKLAVPSKVKRTVEKVQEHSLFATVPTRSPGPPNALAWRGRTYLRGNAVCVILQNDVSALPDEIIAATLSHRYSGVKICLDAMDEMRVREDITIEQMETLLHEEAGTLDQLDHDREVRVFRPHDTYHMRLQEVLLDGIPYTTLEAPVLQLKPGTTWSLVDTRGDATQQQAILTCLKSHVRIACMQGPPATGKTTAEAYLVINADLMIDHAGGLIVVAAETNEAVHVAAEKLYDAMSSHPEYDEDIARDRIVIVDTVFKVNYARSAGLQRQQIISDLMLSSHMRRIAEADPKKFADWLEGEEDHRKRGFIKKRRVWEAHTKQTTELLDWVKSKNPICFSTLSSCHQLDRFFRGTIEASTAGTLAPFACSIFITDEGSQATYLRWTQAFLALNPIQAVIIGDHKQLRPMVKTNEAKPVLERSILHKHMEKGAPFTRLGLQYRSVEELYCATLIHYDDSVHTAPSLQAAGIALGRRNAFYNDIMKLIPRISFIDTSTGRRTRLSHNVHFIDVINGFCDFTGQSHSAFNEIEAEMIKGAVACLLLLGVGPKDLGIITGYNGQYDLLKQKVGAWGVVIKKIDGFQGGQIKFLIVSLVRDLESRIGSLSRADRQNVCMSRAQYAQWVFGSRKVLKQTAAYGKKVHWEQAVQRLEAHPANKGKCTLPVYGKRVQWCIDDALVDYDTVTIVSQANAVNLAEVLLAAPNVVVEADTDSDSDDAGEVHDSDDDGVRRQTYTLPYDIRTELRQAIEGKRVWLQQNVLPEEEDFVAAMKEDFLQLARQSSYYGPGTMEFPLDDYIRELEDGMVRGIVLENLRDYSEKQVMLERYE